MTGSYRARLKAGEPPVRNECLYEIQRKGLLTWDWVGYKFGRNPEHAIEQMKEELKERAKQREWTYVG